MGDDKSARSQDVSVEQGGALCKSVKLACPHLGFVVIVDDGVAVMKILVVVDAGIVVVGEVWESQTGAVLNLTKVDHRTTGAAHVPLPATPTPESSAFMWFHMVSGDDISGS